MARKHDKFRDELGQFKPGYTYPGYRTPGDHIGATGEDNVTSKLTEREVRRIRQLRYQGMIIGDIATQFGVNGETVRAIVRLESWQHVITPYDTYLRRNKDKLGRHLPRMKLEDITQELVREIFRYDPKEGHLRWNMRGRGIQFGEPAGSIANGHLMVGIGGVGIYVARVIWLYMTGKWPKNLIDHKDRNKTNNKWDNLREATKSQDGMNRGLRKDNKTGHPGVYRQKNGLWYAVIHVKDLGTIYLGWSLTYEEAVGCRKAAEKKYFGEFAPANRDRN